MTPRILLTMGRNTAHLHHGAPTPNACVEQAYLDAVLRAGGAPLGLAAGVAGAALDAALDAVHGVLLTGGGDVCPDFYGATAHPAAGGHLAARDATEIALARAALARGVPLLGVCRGIQLLNVALGGTLVQDIPTEWPSALPHRDPDPAGEARHVIDITPDSLLARVIGATALEVNSYHHQAIRDLAPGLVITARARDGVVEAVERPGAPLLAVQFHPEEAPDDPACRALFGWLVETASCPQGSITSAQGTSLGSGIG